MIGGEATCVVQHFYYQDSRGNKSQCVIKVMKLMNKLQEQ
jgi:hypothetical protein